MSKLTPSPSAAASNGVYRRPDGRAWTLMPMTGPIGGGLIGNGTTLFTKATLALYSASLSITGSNSVATLIDLPAIAPTDEHMPAFT